MLVQTNDYKVDGNMPGTAIDFSLSNDSLEHIMDILSDLYSDRPGAIVREYTTNAIDAHIISGQTKPVEISTPNRLNPNLVIRDYGLGMSKDVLVDTYSKYGASTKRSNNLEAGQLGLGSKSAFAYTDQFTVRSVNNGHCCELIMSRNDRGAAEMTIALDYETDDPSGVTITIPINSDDVYDVVEKVNSFAMYAEPGTILVNGEINQRPESWEKVAENLYATSENHSHMVVMGNVAYPAKLDNDNYSYRHKKRLVAYVGMGELDFTPSREELKYTNYTKNTLRLVKQYLQDSITDKVKSMVEQDSSRRSRVLAAAMSRQWSSYFSNGVPVPEPDLSDVSDGTEYLSASFPYDFTDPTDKIRASTTKKRSGEKHKMSEYDVISRTRDKSYAVTDFTGVRATRIQAEKICEINPDFIGKYVVFFEGPESGVSDLFPEWTYVSWEDAKKVKLAKRATPQKRAKDKEGGLYRGCMVHNRRDSYEHLMATNGPAFFVSKTDYKNISLNDLPRGDFKLFFVTAKRQESFVKENPHVKSLTQYVHARRSQIRKMVFHNKGIVDAIPWATPDCFLDWVDFTRVTNQDFLDKIIKAKKGAKWASLANRNYWYYGPFRQHIDENYPLLSMGSSLSSKLLEHSIAYVNLIGEGNVS